MIEAVTKQVWVPATPEAAFRRFTEELESWWPRGTHSVCGDQGVSVRFESGVGGRIVETHVDGTEHVWGTVEGWEPPQRDDVHVAPRQRPGERHAGDR